MTRPALAAAALFVLATGPAHAARECGEGRVTGGTSAAGDALQSYDCAMLARLYCRLAEDRDKGLAADEAVRRTAEWVANVNNTGSHVRGNYAPVLKIAAGEVYRNAQRRPGPTYYRAAYSCGLAKRLERNPAARKGAGPAFDAAVAACEKAHPDRAARSYPNAPLRECLAQAVDRIAPPGMPP